MTKSLVLIGLSGSGKSTVGRLLAPRLHMSFADTDRLIEEQEQSTVAAIFAAEGEPKFREIEAAMLRKVCGQRLIVATGGGSILRHDNIVVMRDGNLVVWLDVAVGILARRLAGHVRGEERPLLHGPSIALRLEQLHRERRSLYRRAAHVRCAAPDGGPSGSHRIAVELATIYRAWASASRE